MTAKERTIYIDPVTGGRLTPEALLRSQGTVELRLFANGWPSWDGALFHIASPDFWFGLGFRNGQLVMQRREFILSVDETFWRSLPSVHTICASWTMEQMTFLLGHIGFQGPSVSRWIAVDPRPAPSSLIRWARLRNLLPTEEFESEHAFVERVHSSLSFLQDKIDEMASPEVFWDVVRDGQRIVRRTPKRETDLQSVIHALLSDQMLVAGIEVIPEYRRAQADSTFCLWVACAGADWRSSAQSSRPPTRPTCCTASAHNCRRTCGAPTSSMALTACLISAANGSTSHAQTTPP